MSRPRLRSSLIAVLAAVALILWGSPAASAAPSPPVSGTSCPDTSHCTPPLKYHGASGCTNCVQHNPRIYLIFWGSKWSSDTTNLNDIKASVGSYAGTALNNILSQYTDSAGFVHNDVTLAGTWSETDPTKDPGTAVNVTNAVSIIQLALKTNTSWSNSNDTQWMIMLQPGAYGVPPGGGVTCGYHGYDTGNNYVFSYVDYPGPVGNTTICNGSAPWRQTQTAFHEYAEAATNPHIRSLYNGDGWFTDESGIGNDQEVGDLCNLTQADYQVWPKVGSGPTPGYQPADPGYIQPLYSNEVSGCTYWRGEDGFVPYGITPHTVSTPLQFTYDGYAWSSSNVPNTPAWGYPTSEQQSVSGGIKQTFSNGSMYDSSTTNSSTAYSVQSPIDGAYGNLGGPGGFLGWPTSDLFVASSGVEENTFGGSGCSGTGSAIIYYPGVTQPNEMHGCIYHDYVYKYGGLNSEFGAPTTGEFETPSNDGRMNRMSGSSCGSSHGSALYFNGSTYPVKGCFYQTYLGMHETTSALGYPISTEYSTSAGTRQDYQGGYMIYNNGTHVYLNYTYFGPNVQVLANNTSTCPGTQQYFTATDANGQPIDWTYSNGSNQCVNVTYQINSPANINCQYDVYVPKGDATGVINFKIGVLNNDIPRWYTHQLDENPVNGWQSLTYDANVFSVQFGDNTGQSYPTQIGWGSQASDGIRMHC